MSEENKQVKHIMVPVELWDKIASIILELPGRVTIGVLQEMQTVVESARVKESKTINGDT